MIHIAKSLAVKLLLLFMLLIILSAILIGSMRLLTPTVSYFRGELETWMSELVQRPVSIGKFSARWHGLGPELVLSSVEIGPTDADRGGLKLAEMRLSLAVLESLRHLEVKTRQVTLSKAKLRVTRHPNGTFTVGGLDSLAHGSGDSSRLFAIPSRIQLEQSDIAFENQLVGDAEPLLFVNVNARLRNDGERHQLEADLPFPGGGRLELKADIQGDFNRVGGWQADLFLAGEEIALTSLLKARIISGYALDSGRLDLRFWAHWEEGRFVHSQGRSDISGLSLRREAGSDYAAQELAIERLGGSFLWAGQAEGWQLDVRNIEFVGNGPAWPESGFSLSKRIDGEGRMGLLAGIGFARAEDLVGIARLLLADNSRISEALEQTAIHGELRNLRFEFEQLEKESRWSLQGQLESLVSRPWRQIPGVDNLDAAFWLGGDGGSLSLKGRSTALVFPGLFRDPLELETLQGQISWARDPSGGWWLESPDILAVSRDIRTNTRLRLDIPSQPGSSAFMDLQTDFSDGLAINAHRYYPVGIMPKAVVSWLDRGIVDGRVISGSALVRGPLRDFPFHKSRNGVFEVFFHTEKMTIDYAPGWPRLTDVAAEVRFMQNGFEVQVERGLIFDSQLRDTRGGIADFTHSPFELQGKVEGALHNNLRLLRESPLAEEFASFTEGMVADGKAVTRVDLSIPIQQGQRLDVAGTVDFAGSSLDLREWQLPLSEIEGRLDFTHRGISARGLHAKALSSAIRLDIETLDEPRALTRISASSHISSRQLAGRFPELDLGWSSGHSLWSLRLDIPHRSGSAPEPASLLVSSNLKGVKIDLPEPFGKSASLERRLSIATEFPQNGSQPFKFQYGSLANLLLLSEETAGGSRSFTRGALELGGGSARLPKAAGLEVGGKLESADLHAWSGLLGSGPGSDASLPLNSIDLELDRLSLGDFGLDDVKVDLGRQQALLIGRISSDQVAGDLRIPDDLATQPLHFRLDRLKLDYDPSRMNGSQSPPVTAGADPTRLPAVDLEAEKTEINGEDYGRLQLVLERLPDGLALQRLSLESDRTQISATGAWTMERSAGQQCALQLSLTTDSLGQLFDDLGYEHFLNGAPGTLETELNWSGSPMEFSPGILYGELDMEFGKGQFLNVDPGIGRVFGLLNISALQRRLSMDFSDLLNKGLAFDSVGGSFTLDGGDAYTTDFQIKGPSAQVDISGRTGLADEDLDQLVTVTPRLSAALPVAGFLAGGPVGGAAMLLAQGLLGKEVDRVSKRQYEVKGPWNDPVFTPLPSGNKIAGAAAEAQVVQQPEPDRPMPEADMQEFGLLKILKKQFTPTEQKYRESRDGAGPGTNP